MIAQETVWNKILPAVQGAIQATFAEDDQLLRSFLYPGQPAAAFQKLFGFSLFEILFKTVLGRTQLSLTRAIETEKGKYVHLEYAWHDTDDLKEGYTAADVSSVTLKKYRQEWRIVDVNPANADFPLTEARAQGILASIKSLNESNKLPAESWILPVALFGGALQLPFNEQALEDGVERLLLPGLQSRHFGVVSQRLGWQLWRDFKKQGKPDLSQPQVWAAAVEWLMGEQTMRDSSPATVGNYYRVTLGAGLPAIRQIKETLTIRGVDQRYSPIAGTSQIVVKPE